MTGRVCIVGMGHSTWSGLEDEQDGTEIWSLNQGHLILPKPILDRCTRWFQIHSFDAMVARQRNEEHLKWLKSTTIPVYLEERREDIPTSVRYPYEDVCGSLHGNYFATNSFGYMLAFAIYGGWQEIAMYGVDFGPLDYGDGYARPQIEFLLGLAMGRGIRVSVPEKSALLKGDLYGRTVMLPSTGVEVALDALRRVLQGMPYISGREGLGEAMERVERWYREGVRGKARY